MNESIGPIATGAPVNPGRLISLIIPMLNEKAGLDLLFSSLQDAFRNLPVRFELVIVDDGSTDGTREVLPEKLAQFESWQLIFLARNFGQQAAYRAGLDVARGEAVIFLDADLQDPPHLIAKLVEKWHAGFKVVTAVRRSRVEQGPRRWAFDLFHWLFERLTKGVMPRNSGMFALLDRVVVEQLRRVSEVNLFLPALKNWFGFAQATIVYDRAARAVGEPKQSLRKLCSYALNGIVSFSEVPLQWIGLAGLALSLVSFGYAGFLVIVKLLQMLGILQHLQVQGFTTLAVAIFCLGGIQLICLGILGQYLARIYREVKRRPLFIVQSRLQSDE